ncbi:hypothetical protein [Micropruina sp.]|uniref:hypothetical protein n=1 Tax=Micropruina sp. TaxID=2737536 RepID=UPI0039E4D7C2
MDANGNAVVGAWAGPKPKESKEDKENEKGEPETSTTDFNKSLPEKNIEILKESESPFKRIETTDLVAPAGWPGRADSDGAEVLVPVGRTFIRAEERPTVVARIVADPDDN